MAFRRRVAILTAFALTSMVGQSAEQTPRGPFNDPATSFTIAQSARGKDLYQANCQMCHGADLAGGQFGPALRGPTFQSRWGAQPPEALFAHVRTMPPAAPGSLNAAAYAAIDAYILQTNGVAPGTTELAASVAAAPAPASGAPPVDRGSFARAQPNHDAIYVREIARRNTTLGKLSPVTDEMLRAPPDGDWLMWRRTYAGLGFSPLRQINTRNVSRLHAAWSWSLRPSGNEITPLVHDGVMLIHSGDTIEALDAASGDLLWQYVRALPDAQNGGRSARSKGMAIYQNAVFAPIVDGHVIALDVRTGKLLWDREILSPAQIAQGVQLNGVPIVAKGKVIMGVTLSLALKVGCFIFALDAHTGAEAWRFHTVARPGQPGGDSWNGAPVEERFGGALWTGGSYDPELDLVYFGAGNTYNTATLLKPPYQQGPSNAGLYTESTVALKPDSGALAWYYQHMTRDVWDMDWSFEQSLIDLPIDGATRKLLVTGGKLALFDAVDRADGRFVFSRDAGLQNIVVAVDPKTGEKTINPALAPVLGEKKFVCPGASGHRNWQATSYNPDTHILYVPMFEACADFTWIPRDAAQTAAGGIDQRFQTRPMPNSDGNFGRIQAINLQTGKTVWTVRQRSPISSAMLATAGGIVFNGSRDRYFSAYDQANGKVLWQTRLGTAPSTFPITYSIKGVQYVAVVAGGGNPQDTGPGPLTPEIVNPTAGTTLWIFKLP